MNSKLLSDRDGARTFVVVFEHGDTVMEPLLEFLKAESVQAARLTGIGALQSVTLGYFDWETKEYEHHRIDEQVELLSLTGDVALSDGEPQVHAHVVVGLRDTTVRGGHLVDATVRPTLELVVDDVPEHLAKRVDQESGLALIAPQI
jgi:predicted DNA-binding protein with PD1-like motif